MRSWTKTIDKALRTPRRGSGLKAPRTMMVEEYAIGIGCFFPPSGHPLWNVSVGLHNSPGLTIDEWNPLILTNAEAMINSIFSYCGEGEIIRYRPPKSPALHQGRKMSGREISVAFKRLAPLPKP